MRVTAWCRRFIGNCCKGIEDRTKGDLGVEEYESAEALWIKAIQIEMKLENGYNKRKESPGIFEDEREGAGVGLERQKFNLAPDFQSFSQRTVTLQN